MPRTKRTEGKGNHGLLKNGARPPEHAIWKMMIQKCCNPNNSEYPKFGALGICIADRWLAADGFENFLADVGPRPFSGAGLRLLDPQGNFEPGNVEWADTRAKHTLTYDGRTLSLADWAVERGLNERTVRARHRHGVSVQEILDPYLAQRDHLARCGTRARQKAN